MMDKPVFITEIIEEVVRATNAKLKADDQSWLSVNRKNINYEYGSEAHIIEALRSLKEGTKYPMIAMMMAIGAERGNSAGLYGRTVIPAIYIATLSDNLRLPPAKYRDNFKPILQPIYEQFLWQLCRHKSYMGLANPNLIQHTPKEYPADVDKTNTVFTDFLDIIAIYDLSFTIKQQPLRSCA